jgi:hypothetical protein
MLLNLTSTLADNIPVLANKKTEWSVAAAERQDYLVDNKTCEAKFHW